MNNPKWINKAPKKGSFRSIFKYGSPTGFKHPNERLVEELKIKFGLKEEDLKKMESTGNEVVPENLKTKLSFDNINKFISISGNENVSSKTYDRLKYSTGKTVEEAMKLRKGIIDGISDLVIHPRNKSEIKQIVNYCHKEKIPIYTYGGGTSVNFGYYPEKGGVSLVISTHLNKIISFNEKNQTARVQAGMLGPDFEKALNKAPELYGTKHSYTCGHFPQSFEYSSLGGWFVTLGSGQQSSYYGDAGDLVLGIEMISPIGKIITKEYPAAAIGPNLKDIIKGSEGIYGIVVELTWKVFRNMPKNRKRFAYIFPNWKAAVNASREISQGEFGMPSVFRISDAEETHHGLKLYGIEGTIIDKIMTLRGYKPQKRCLFIGSSDGDKDFTKLVKKKVHRICKENGAMYLTSYPVKKWETGRYQDPYLREDLMDYGILIDTLETSVTWDILHKVHKQVRAFIKERPQTICMTHASHFYPQGTNLYFIFIIKETDIDAYRKFQEGIIDIIQKSGGSLSHHHGIGKMLAKWMPEHLGENELKVLKALKKHFDPNNIINPGKKLLNG